MRRRSVVKRELTPDVKYNSELIARLINTIMTRGKKATAEGIVYDALDLIQSKKADMPAIDVFTQALENVKRLSPKETYFVHMSHHIGVHAEAEKQLPEHVHFAYDEMVLTF